MMIVTAKRNNVEVQGSIEAMAEQGVPARIAGVLQLNDDRLREFQIMDIGNSLGVLEDV